LDNGKLFVVNEKEEVVSDTNLVGNKSDKLVKRILSID
jgi:hypothetical protein